MGVVDPHAGTKLCPQCGENIGQHAVVCHFCRYRFDVGRRARRRAPRFVSALTAAVILAALIVLVVVWTTGALDKPLSLYEASINAHVCYRSPSGAVACGGAAQPRCSARTSTSTVAPLTSHEKCFGGLIDQRDTLIPTR